MSTHDVQDATRLSNNGGARNQEKLQRTFKCQHERCQYPAPPYCGQWHVSVLWYIGKARLKMKRLWICGVNNDRTKNKGIYFVIDEKYYCNYSDNENDL